jgi:hypothetical protein
MPGGRLAARRDWLSRRSDTRGRGENPYPWCQRVAEGGATQTAEQPLGVSLRTNDAGTT